MKNKDFLMSPSSKMLIKPQEKANPQILSRRLVSMGFSQTARASFMRLFIHLRAGILEIRIKWSQSGSGLKGFPEFAVLEVNNNEALNCQEGFRKFVRHDGLIILHGGGNLGGRGLWPERECRTDSPKQFNC